MGIITSQSRFTETYPIPAIAETISSLKFLDSFEAAALSFEVFRPRRVLTFPFVRVLPVVFFFVVPISAKTPQARTRGWLLRKAKHEDLFGDEIHVAQNFHQEVTGSKHNKK